MFRKGEKMKNDCIVNLNIWHKSVIHLHDMEKEIGTLGNNPESQACEFAKLVMNYLPGNTLDIILAEMAKEIRVMLDNPNHVEILKSEWDIQNRLRHALNRLEEESDK